MFRDPVSPEVVEPYQFIFDSPQVRASFELADYAAREFSRGHAAAGRGAGPDPADFRGFQIRSPRPRRWPRRWRRSWKSAAGVCQDFAHLGIACLRSLGLPARYVSGYLRTRPPEGKPRLAGADASHAWFAVFCPGTGWVDFDPTNNVQPAEEHITWPTAGILAMSARVAGILTGGGKHAVKVAVDVAEV